MANSKAIEAGGAFVRLFTDKSPMVRGLRDARATFDNWAAGIGSAGAKLLGAGAAGFTGGAVAVKQFADMGSALNDMSVRTGVSVEELSGLKYAAEQNGSSLEALEGGLKKYSKTAVAATQGNKEALDAFRTLGISIAELNGMSAEDQLELIGNQLNKLPEGARRSAAAMGIFGKSGSDLIPVLTDLRANMDRAKELGLGWTTEEAANADALGDRLDDLKSVALRTVQVIGSALAPTVMELSEPLLAAAVATREWIDENPGVIQTVAMVTAGVAGLGVALLGTAGVISVTASAMGVASSAWMAFGAVIASPIALPAALLGLGYVVTTQTEIGKNAVKGLRDTFPGVTVAANRMASSVSESFGMLANDANAAKDEAVGAWHGIVNAVGSGDLALAGEIAMAGLESVFLTGTHSIRDAWAVSVAYVSSAWTDVTSVMQTVGEEAFAAIATSWVSATGTIAATGENLSAWFATLWLDIKGFAFDAFDAVMNKWDDASGFFADRIIEIGVATGAIEGDAEEIKKTRREDTTRRQTTRIAGIGDREKTRQDEQTKIESDRAAAVAKINTDTAEKKAGIEENRVAGRKGIEQQRLAEQDRIAAERDAKLTGNQTRVEEAKARLRELMDKAAAQKSSKDKKPPKKPGDEGPDIGSAGGGGKSAEATVSGLVSSLNRGGSVGSPEEQKKNAVDRTTEAVGKQKTAYEELTQAIKDARDAAVAAAKEQGKTPQEQKQAGIVAARDTRNELLNQSDAISPEGMPDKFAAIRKQREDTLARQAAKKQRASDIAAASGNTESTVAPPTTAPQPPEPTEVQVVDVAPQSTASIAPTLQPPVSPMPEMPSAITLDSIRTMVASIRIPDISAISQPSTARTESTLNAQAMDIEPLLAKLDKLIGVVEHGGTLTA